MYDSFAFEFIENLKPSGRGELEVTDLNNAYLAKGQLFADVLEGWWCDAGSSIDGLLDANVRAAQLWKATR